MRYLDRLFFLNNGFKFIDRPESGGKPYFILNENNKEIGAILTNLFENIYHVFITDINTDLRNDMYIRTINQFRNFLKAAELEEFESKIKIE